MSIISLDKTISEYVITDLDLDTTLIILYSLLDDQVQNLLYNISIDMDEDTKDRLKNDHVNKLLYIWYRSIHPDDRLAYIKYWITNPYGSVAIMMLDTLSKHSSYYNHSSSYIVVSQLSLQPDQYQITITLDHLRYEDAVQLISHLPPKGTVHVKHDIRVNAAALPTLDVTT